MYKIMKEDKPFKWEGEVFHRNSIINKTDKWERHPAKVIGYPYSMELSDEEDFTFHVFTDGSRSNDKVGAAFVVMDEKLSIVEFRQYSLPKFCDNFQAEVVALTKAIEYISSKQYKKVQIVTDSLSALQAISNPHNENPMIWEVKELIESNRGNGITQLAYIKGHAGNPGNELADDLAKTAADQGEKLLG